MPTIACPGCGKKYKLPATAAGQVAKCACGKRFKVGSGSAAAASAKSKSDATATSAAKPLGAGKVPTPPVQAKPTPAKRSSPAELTKTVASKLDDDFWDEGLSEPVTAAAVVETPKPAAASPVAPKTPLAAAEKPAKKKRKKFRGIKWGFDWGKVVGGTIAFLVFGGLVVAIVMSTGRFSRATAYLAVPAIGGLFTAINGLMGEEGVW